MYTGVVGEGAYAREIGRSVYRNPYLPSEWQYGVWALGWFRKDMADELARAAIAKVEGGE